jgi:hypothetical protein|nr:MAG TPA: hypothetical protein [Caudoviricetes sp.]
MDDFKSSCPKPDGADFNINNLLENDKIWVPLMLGFIFGAASKKVGRPER